MLGTNHEISVGVAEQGKIWGTYCKAEISYVVAQCWGIVIRCLPLPVHYTKASCLSVVLKTRCISIQKLCVHQHYSIILWGPLFLLTQFLTIELSFFSQILSNYNRMRLVIQAYVYPGIVLLRLSLYSSLPSWRVSPCIPIPLFAPAGNNVLPSQGSHYKCI